MTKIDIFSGFLGAGKTTLIKKLLKDAYAGQQVVLIENEFGEIGIDGGFMKEAGIQVTEMNSGCICCSLVGDFGEALQKVLDTYHPDRILIEPSGVGKLSDVVKAASVVCGEKCVIGSLTAVVDAGKCKVYIKNFGEFFLNQIEHAATIILSRTDVVSQARIEECVRLIREHNQTATIITTPADELDGKQILAAMEKADTLENEMMKMRESLGQDDDECDDPDCCCHHHHHHDNDDDECDDPACTCHHHHHHHHDDDDDDECDDPACACHHHHQDDDDDDDDECDGHHHHDDDDHETGHHHHHHHHHDADEVFTSWGCESPKAFGEDELRGILSQLEDADAYGQILRAKGIVPAADAGQWIHFDYTPGEIDIRRGGAEVTGRLCVIGSHLKDNAVKVLFGV